MAPKKAFTLIPNSTLSRHRLLWYPKRTVGIAPIRMTYTVFTDPLDICLDAGTAQVTHHKKTYLATERLTLTMLEMAT